MKTAFSPRNSGKEYETTSDLGTFMNNEAIAKQCKKECYICIDKNTTN